MSDKKCVKVATFCAESFSAARGNQSADEDGGLKPLLFRRFPEGQREISLSFTPALKLLIHKRSS
jgi:hypothetical protein